MMLSFWALVSLPNPALSGGAWMGTLMLLFFWGKWKWLMQIAGLTECVLSGYVESGDGDNGDDGIRVLMFGV